MIRAYIPAGYNSAQFTVDSDNVSQFHARPLDLCSVCLVVLQCQQPCMTHSTGWVSRSVSRSSYLCWHTSVCTVWHPTTCRASARSWPSSVTFSWRKQTAGPTVLHDQLWTAFLRVVWPDCLERHAGPSAQLGLNSKWPQTPLCSGLFRYSYSARLCDSLNLLTERLEMLVYYYLLLFLLLRVICVVASLLFSVCYAPPLSTYSFFLHYAERVRHETDRQKDRRRLSFRNAPTLWGGRIIKK